MRWTRVWVGSGSWFWTGKPGVLQSVGSQSWTWLSGWTELNWIELLGARPCPEDPLHREQFRGACGSESTAGGTGRGQRSGGTAGSCPWHGVVTWTPSAREAAVVTWCRAGVEGRRSRWEGCGSGLRLSEPLSWLPEVLSMSKRDQRHQLWASGSRAQLRFPKYGNVKIVLARGWNAISGIRTQIWIVKLLCLCGAIG